MPGSPLAARAEIVVDCLAGIELAVPASKSVTSMAAILLWAAALTGGTHNRTAAHNRIAAIDVTLLLAGTASSIPARQSTTISARAASGEPGIVRQRDQSPRRERVERRQDVGGTPALRERDDARIAKRRVVEPGVARGQRERPNPAPPERERAEHPDEQRASAADEEDVAARDGGRDALRAVRRGDAPPDLGLLANLRFEVRAEHSAATARRTPRVPGRAVRSDRRGRRSSRPLGRRR